MSVGVVCVTFNRPGEDFPDHHWLYIPDSAAGFHRIGFYSNVDGSFVPGDEDRSERVSIYV
jgi:protoporphyrinogen oxidase